MSTYTVRIAIEGMSSSWRITKAVAGTAERALEIAETRERAEGYTVIALQAENDRDAHDFAAKGAWPFKVSA